MEKGNIAGLIVAAGMSSRMEDFKPLLPLDGKPILQHSIDNLRVGGAKSIMVVIGNRARDLQPLLESSQAGYVLNPQYSTTDMFTSVKIGLRQLARCDAVFFMPGDVPLFLPYSLQVMQRQLQSPDVGWVQPCYKGQSGHPVLIASVCFDTILSYEGECGLQGALSICPGRHIGLDLPDKGCLLDADTPEDYEELRAYVKLRKIPDDEICLEILKYFALPQKTIDHGLMVAEMSEQLARRLTAAGHVLDLRLIRAGAILHDVAKGHKDHARIGAQWIAEMGYPEVAEVISAHMDLAEESLLAMDEKAVVSLADKYVKGCEHVTMDQRFASVFQRWRDDRLAYEAIVQRQDAAKRLEQRFQELIQKI